MKIQEILRISPKGQVTIPNKMRKRLHFEDNGFISCRITKEGLLLFPVEIREKSPYTSEEFRKIEKLASEEGKSFKSSPEAKKFLKSL